MITIFLSNSSMSSSKAANLLARFKISRNKLRFHATNLKHFSSLGSPMFPQKSQIELSDDVLAGKSKTPNNDESFVSKHSGKLALIVVSYLGYLIYSFVKGGQLKTEEEDNVRSQSSIDPDEINELRLVNNVSFDEFVGCVAAADQHFNDHLVSYEDFTSFVLAYFRKPIKHGHLLDRVFLNTLKNSAKTEISVKSEEANNIATTRSFLANGQEEEHGHRRRPLHYFFTLLSMIAPLPGWQRAQLLFIVGRSNTKDQEGRNNGSEEETITFTSTTDILQDLIDTSQVALRML